MGKGYIYGLVFLLLLLPVYSEIYSEDGDIFMDINIPPHAKIIKQTGFEQNFDYTITKEDMMNRIKVCHKDFDKTKNSPNLNSYKAEKQDKQSKSTKESKSLNLKNNKCDEYLVEITESDLIRLGDESTEIIIDGDNVTLQITPEYENCEGILCSSEIIIRNYGGTNVVFDSDDIIVSIENSLSHQILFFNGTELADASTGQVVTIEPDEEQVFIVNAVMQDYGLFKYNVTINYSGLHTIDPYYLTTNSTPPFAEFNTPTGLVILPSSVFNISGDALDYYNLTDVTYEVTKPSLAKTNFSLPIQTGFDAYRDNPLYIASDNFATYFGDFNSVYVRLGRYLILYPTNNIFNRVAFEINSMVGDPENDNLNYDIIICPTNVTTLTTSTDRASDCTSAPVTVGDAINLSEQIGSSQFGMFEMLKLQNLFNMTNTTKYILAFEYDSGYTNDGANDFWTVQVDSFTGFNNYGRVLNTNSTFYTNVLPNLRLFRDYNLTYPDTSAQGNYTVRLYATDHHGNTNSSETIMFRVCEHNWTAQYSSCLANDTQTKTYIDSNDCPIGDPVPVDNGTATVCNYCSEDLELQTSLCFRVNGTDWQNESYTDNNYFSCCALTSLPSDCSILTYPYNSTVTVPCVYQLEDDFVIELDIDIQFGFGFGGINSDKITGNIWINDTNTTYYCLSYVKDISGNLLQTNPAYTERVGGGILQIMPKEVESREFFVTKNGLAQVYWQNDNIIQDKRNYIWGVQCSGNGQLLKSEVVASAGYENVNEPITRWVWAKENIFGIVVFFFILLVIGIALFFLYRVVFK